MKKLLILFALTLAFQSFSQKMIVTISGIRSTKGYIQLHFFTSSENYVDEKPAYKLRYDKSTVKNGVMVITVTEVPPGHYGMGILDDENGNRKMDFGVMLPEEGFGFSNYYHKGFSRPKFENFDFDLTKEGRNIWAKLRYL